MDIIPIHGVTKIVIKEKVEENLLKVVGISRLEESIRLNKKENG